MHNQLSLFFTIFICQSILALVCLLITIKISIPITFSDASFNTSLTRAIFVFAIPVGLIYTGISYLILHFFGHFGFLMPGSAIFMGTGSLDFFGLILWALVFLAILVCSVVVLYLYLIDKVFNVFRFATVENLIKVSVAFCFIYVLLTSVSFEIILSHWFK